MIVPYVNNKSFYIGKKLYNRIYRILRGWLICSKYANDMAVNS